MGKNNRARRAAKAKKTARPRTEPNHRRTDRPEPEPTPPGESTYSREDVVQFVWERAAGASALGGDVEFCLVDLCAADTLEAGLVSRVGEQLLLRFVDRCWTSGWQPVELVRQGKRGTATSAASRLVALAVAHDNADRRAATLDPRWMLQIDHLDLPPADGRSGWFDRWQRNEGLDRTTALRAAIDAAGALGGVPRLDVLIPPPGASSASEPHRWVAPGPVGVDADPMLERIRNLLAKAESTDFEAEAEAFTAKAQELMTRHAIDAALLAAGGAASGERPSMIRVAIDAPYADAKSLLLHVVAEAGRCRAAGYAKLDLVAVMGFATDLAAVEMLFTSLLVQAQSSLAESSRRAPPGTRARSQSFRSAFLVAYAHRVAERLREVNAHVVDQVTDTSGASVQLVLRDRSKAVDDAFAERFDQLRTVGVRGGYDRAGYASGVLAADRARLTGADLTGATARSSGAARELGGRSR